jgi:3-methyl-2-oxobutanoate hydroxymethyltransferase
MAQQITIRTLKQYKEQGKKIVALTAYDYSIAQVLDRNGVDIILVGDSLAMVALGHKSTHPVTIDQMIYHTQAVVRGVERALVVADMPFMSYQEDLKQAVKNAGRFIKEGQAQAIKLEGASKLILETVERLVDIGIPVMGHLGFTPQSVHALGGFRVQGKSAEKAMKLVNDAQALERVGVFGLVLEMVPATVSKLITENLEVPTIGIGAGLDCDGQILVTDDMLGKFTDFKPSFVRYYANLADISSQAITHYVNDVRTSNYPNNEESFHLTKEEESALLSLFSSGKTCR